MGRAFACDCGLYLVLATNAPCGHAAKIPREAKLAERSPRRGLGRGNVAAEFLGLGVNLLETLLYDVTDTDDAVEGAILDDRQVANALARHHFHQIDELVAGGAGLDLAGHQLVEAVRSENSVVVVREIPRTISRSEIIPRR